MNLNNMEGVYVYDDACRQLLANHLYMHTNQEREKLLEQHDGLIGYAKYNEYDLTEIPIDKELHTDTYPLVSDKKLSSHLDEEYPIMVVPITSRHYPEALRYIFNPPTILFVRGDVSVLNSRSIICIIGTRHETPYGAKVIKDLVNYLKRRKPTIVSGMAMGTDALAHKAALDNDLKTIAILGSGVDVCYPKLHRELYSQILCNGCIVSEFMPGTSPRRQNFPARNRLLSGIAQHVVITEAGERSGTMITANFAAEQAKEVWAVPNSLYISKARGCHKLIEQGARILYDFHSLYEQLPASSDEYFQLLTFIQSTNPDLQEIVAYLQQDYEEVQMQLSYLRLLNLIERSSGFYRLTENGHRACNS